MNLVNREERIKDFMEEFGPPQRTRTVDIAQTIAEVYGYWYNGRDFIIIKRDQKGRYDPLDAKYITDKEFYILLELDHIYNHIKG